MDRSILATIIVGALTLLFSYLIYRIQKIRRYPGRLSFTVNEFLRVMSNTPVNYDKLSLMYDNYQVKDNLIFIKFCIFNDQKYDCSCQDESTQITVKLPDGAKWIDVKESKGSDDVESKVRIIDEHIISVNFNLLRNGEFVCFEGLVESSNHFTKGSLQDSIIVKHRIPNVDKIKKVSVLSSDIRNKTKKMYKICVAYSIICFLLLLFLLLSAKNVNPLKYTEIDTGVNRFFFLDSNNELVYVTKTFPWTTYSKPVSKDSFIKSYTPCFIRDSKLYPDLFVIFMIAIGLVFILPVALIEGQSIHKTKKIEKMLGQ